MYFSSLLAIIFDMYVFYQVKFKYVILKLFSDYAFGHKWPKSAKYICAHLAGWFEVVVFKVVRIRVLHVTFFRVLMHWSSIETPQ